ncbi:RNA polymerase sigma-70 factor, ECF subfamily [Prauserella flava]|nr:RNA polymerase sigma-70 factor, ECF subfamily [Prauserella flava]MCR3737185.1 RNA polymerase sigma-70 factor, ECF subfamily [Prauserella salsuginis]
MGITPDVERLTKGIRPMEVPQLSQSSTTQPTQEQPSAAAVAERVGGDNAPAATASDATGNVTSAPAASPGDVAATWTPPTWDEVVREHADRVYRLAYRLSGNAHDAEDLTQETFIRVFRSLASYKPGTFEGWLHRITTNLFLDMARRRSRVRMEGLPEDTDRIVGDDPSPEQVFSETHLDPDLQTALAELPPEFRAAVVLCDVEGLSYEEIGATLGVKLGTVRSRIHRGRQALKASLERAAATREREALG